MQPTLGQRGILPSALGGPPAPPGEHDVIVTGVEVRLDRKVAPAISDVSLCPAHHPHSSLSLLKHLRLERS